MTFLTLGDLHGRIEWTEDLEAAAQIARAVLICGDITSFGGPEDASRVLDEIQPYCDTILAVAGNCDSPAIQDYLTERGISLHGRGVMLEENIGLCGVSGSNTTPFGTPLEYTEEELSAVLRTGWMDVEAAPVRIILHHAPPYHTKCDRTRIGFHVGVRELRVFCEEYQPELVVCGHIHEARGLDNIGKTIIANGGMAARGYGVRVTVSEDGVYTELI